MCLIAIAWQAHPRYDLIVAANRDEFHARATRAAHWWPDAPSVYGGRDQRAGGAWCAADTAGRFAAVTNVREPGPRRDDLRSRGLLVHGALAQSGLLLDHADGIAAERQAYGPFNLLLAGREQLQFLSNRGNRQRVTVPAGVHAVSNGHWGEHWSKTQRAQRELQALLQADALSPQALFALLSEGDPAPAETLPDTGVGPDTEQLLSSLFIHGRTYGTRASTLILRDRRGRIDFHERAFDADARVIHDQHEYWSFA